MSNPESFDFYRKLKYLRESDFTEYKRTYNDWCNRLNKNELYFGRTGSGKSYSGIGTYLINNSKNLKNITIINLLGDDFQPHNDNIKYSETELNSRKELFEKISEECEYIDLYKMSRLDCEENFYKILNDCKKYSENHIVIIPGDFGLLSDNKPFVEIITGYKCKFIVEATLSLTGEFIPAGYEYMLDNWHCTMFESSGSCYQKYNYPLLLDLYDVPENFDCKVDILKKKKLTQSTNSMY